jgi:ATP-dependent DNA helicase RecG
MNIARGSNEDLRPINVGLLLFNDKPHRFFRGAQIDLVEYKDEIGDHFSENIFTGPIQYQLRDALRYLKNNLIKEFVQKVEGQAEANRFYNYPYEALEEVLANAVYHKSYDHQNPIEVNIRLDRVEIISYAGPMPPVNQEMLNSDRIIARDYRNSRLGDFLKEMDLTEGRSTGIPKIRYFMKRNGSPAPVFTTDADLNYFLVTLYPHPLADQEEARRQLEEQVTEQVTEQVQRILEVLSTSPLSTQQAMEKLGLRHRPTFNADYLKPALNSGWIEMTQPNSPKSPTQKYRLTPKGLSLQRGLP